MTDMQQYYKLLLATGSSSTCSRVVETHVSSYEAKAEQLVVEMS
jgi:hypothetical protein